MSISPIILLKMRQGLHFAFGIKFFAEIDKKWLQMIFDLCYNIDSNLN